MNLLIDTCSWLKLDILDKLKLFSIDLLYRQDELTITHDIAFELEYYKCSTWKKEKTTVVPVKNRKIYDEATAYNFDKADASILSNGSKEFNPIIITEDGGIIQFAKIYRFSVQQLIDFFRWLTQRDIISKNLLFKINKVLRDLKNITVKKEKEIKKWLTEF